MTGNWYQRSIKGVFILITLGFTANALVTIPEWLASILGAVLGLMGVWAIHVWESKRGERE